MCSLPVDPSAPEIVTLPHFLSPRDGSRVSSQWDRSVLHLAWEFNDQESPVVRHTVYIRSLLTGRLLVEPVMLGADSEVSRLCLFGLNLFKPETERGPERSCRINTQGS